MDPRSGVKKYVRLPVSLKRHPDRSGGIFLAHRYSAVCGIAENGKPLAKGARNDGVRGRFLAALEMTMREPGVF